MRGVNGLLKNVKKYKMAKYNLSIMQQKINARLKQGLEQLKKDIENNE